MGWVLFPKACLPVDREDVSDPACPLRSGFPQAGRCPLTELRIGSEKK
jgi:hypothetical protein